MGTGNKNNTCTSYQNETVQISWARNEERGLLGLDTHRAFLWNVEQRKATRFADVMSLCECLAG